MTAAYTEKAIDLIVNLDAQEAVKLSGFACTVSVTKSAAPAFPTATVDIKGLSLELMERMTFLGFKAFGMAGNKIQIMAGEKGTTLPLIFEGDIMNAWADFNPVPSPVFRFEARGGLFCALAAQSPVSVEGNAKAEDMVRQLATEQGLEFENNGVTASVSNCVLTGSPVDKMRQVAEMAGADLLFDDGKVVLIAKQTVRTAEGAVPLINASNGMIGYPTFSNKGITFSTFFRPDLRVGASVEVETIVPRASGTWKIVGLSHELSAVEEGSWKTTAQCIYPMW